MTGVSPPKSIATLRHDEAKVKQAFNEMVESVNQPQPEEALINV